MGRVLGVAAWLGWFLAPVSALASPNPAGAWLALSAEYRFGTWVHEWSGFVTLNVPFDRVSAPRAVRDPAQLTEDAPKKPESSPPVPSLRAEPEPSRPNVAVLLTPRLARGAVRHALASAGYLRSRSRLASLSARARHSAVLPEVRLRTQRSSGQTLRLTPTNDDPYRYTQAGTSELAFEARLTWHLDRLVFAEEEVSIERLEHERDAAERRLIQYVLERLLAWQRGRVRSLDPDLLPEARDAAELDAVAASVELDVLTEGWFSEAIDESALADPARAGEPAKVEVNSARHAR